MAATAADFPNTSWQNVSEPVSSAAGYGNIGFSGDPVGSNGIGSAILGGLGRGALGAIDNFFGGPQGAAGGTSSASPTPYSDRTRDLLNMLIADAIDSFETPKSTI